MDDTNVEKPPEQEKASDRKVDLSLPKHIKVDVELPSKPFPACLRTGMCCENILLENSPATLRAGFRAWQLKNDRRLPLDQWGRRDEPGKIIDEEIWMIYPMLAGRCRGKIQMDDKSWRYVYGPCKNLGAEKVGQMSRAVCTIHEDRPRMCWVYPTYSDLQHITMNSRDPKMNPSYTRGCGFNNDKTKGYAPAELATEKLVLLEIDER